jgi:hypothetical protein
MGKLESSKLLHKRGNESHTVYKTAFPPPGHPYRRPESLASIPGGEGHCWQFHLAPYPESPPVRKQGTGQLGRKILAAQASQSSVIRGYDLLYHLFTRSAQSLWVICFWSCDAILRPLVMIHPIKCLLDLVFPIADCHNNPLSKPNQIQCNALSNP